MTSDVYPSASCAIIAGSGLYDLEAVAGSYTELVPVATPYSEHPVEVLLYEVNGQALAFLPRHGIGHRLPPHRIPYKANLIALSKLGVKKILAVNAVGSVDPSLSAGTLVVPDQIIDYTWGRDHTYFDNLSALNQHIDFTYPYDEDLRQVLINSLSALDISETSATGTYGCTQGPRLETAAEIQRMKIDGCTLVGQTAMPETALARELDMKLASLCLVVNRGAGLDPAPLAIDDIIRNLSEGMTTITQVLKYALDRLLLR